VVSETVRGTAAEPASLQVSVLVRQRCEAQSGLSLWKKSEASDLSILRYRHFCLPFQVHAQIRAFQSPVRLDQSAPRHGMPCCDTSASLSPHSHVVAYSIVLSFSLDISPFCEWAAPRALHGCQIVWRFTVEHAGGGDCSDQPTLAGTFDIRPESQFLT
jgi:hypothetical protein